MKSEIPSEAQRKIIINSVNNAIKRMADNVNSAIFAESASGKERFDAPPNGARFTEFDKKMILASPKNHRDGLCLPTRD